MTGGFLDSFSGALDGVTEADAAALGAQRDGRTPVEDDSLGDTTAVSSVVDLADATVTASMVTPERDVPVQVRDGSRALLSGSMFASPIEPRDPITLWVHTDGEAHEILFGEPILLGRRAPAGDTRFIHVSSDKVSREHCGVRVVDGRATCVDLGSTNGTWIDRSGDVLEVCEEPVQVYAGDKICTMVNQVVIARIGDVGVRP